MKIENEKTYDSVFWTSVVKMSEYLIPLVNEVFGENYSDNAIVQLKSNKQVTELPDNSLQQSEMDTLATLTEMDVSRDYHFEVETWEDNTFAIRIAEYATGAAYDSVVLTEQGARMTIPYTAVIFLRSSDSMPNSLKIDIDYPGGVASYEAPVVKLKDYSIDELFEKRLLLLLPFFGFNFDDRFKQMETDGINELKDSILDIDNRLAEMVRHGDINKADRGHLMEWIERVLKKLTVKYKNVSKEVDEVMGVQILHSKIDDAWDAGVAKGNADGREEGVKAIVEILKDIGGTSIDAAEKIVATMDYSRPEADMLVAKYW